MKRSEKPSDFGLYYKIDWQVGSITWGGILLWEGTEQQQLGILWVSSFYVFIHFNI